MLPTVDDVHHRDGQNASRCAAHVAIKWLSREVCRSFCSGKRYPKDRIRTQAAFVVSAIELDHGCVDRLLLGRVKANQRFSDLAIHGINGVQNAFSHVARLVAITLFNRFMCTGGGARRYGCAAHRAIFQIYVHFHSRVASAVENFTAVNVNDRAHGVPRMNVMSPALYSRRTKRVEMECFR